MKLNKGQIRVLAVLCLLSVLCLSVSSQTKRRGKVVNRTVNNADETAVGPEDVFNARADFGAVGNGIADDTPALTRAVAAARNSKPLYLPSGTYRITSLQLPDNLMLIGDGRTKTIIKSAGQDRSILEVATSGQRIIVRDLQIQGTATPINAGDLTEQHGFRQRGTTISGIEMSNVMIKNVGGNGVKIENAFSSNFTNVETDLTFGDAFDIASAGPNLTFINTYVHSLGSNNTCAYRLRAGRPVLINANGVDGPQTAGAGITWAIVGENLRAGDPGDRAAFPTFINPNIEAFSAFGILHHETSSSNIIGGHFTPLGSAVNVELIRFNGGSLVRGLIDSTTVFAGNRANYRNGREIRSYGPAPVVIWGPVGAYQGFDKGVTDYFNFESNTIEPLRRIDDWLTRKQVSDSYVMRTNETKLIDVRHNQPVMITLMNAAAAGDGATVTIKDGAGIASSQKITVAANDSKLDGAMTQTISADYGSLTFYSDGRDWFSLQSRSLVANDPHPRPVIGGLGRRNVIARASGSSPLNFNLGNIQHVMLVGDVTISELLNARDGASYTIIFQQDESGGRKVNLPQSMKFPGGQIPVWSTSPAAVDMVKCDSNGSNLYCLAYLNMK